MKRECYLWNWTCKYKLVRKGEMYKFITTRGVVFATDADHASQIVSKRLETSTRIIVLELSVIRNDDPDGYICFDELGDFSNNVDEGTETSDVAWKIWEGWRGNHDKRIDNAKCSKCGYVHPIVKGSLDRLREVCPVCKSIINEAEYEDGKREKIYR